MGVVELVFGSILWIAAALGMTTIAAHGPFFTKQEPAGKGNPKVEVTDDVRTILEQWEKANEGVKSTSLSGTRLVYDERFKTVRISHVEFESADDVHWQFRVFPYRISQDNHLINQKYRAQWDTAEEWSSDGDQLRHRNIARQESESIQLSSLEDPSLILESYSPYRLFVGFSADKFLGRFNVFKGEVVSSDGKPVHHLVFEPHAEGIEGEFLRHGEKFEVILDAKTLELVAIKEMPRDNRICVYKLSTVELKK